MNKLYFADEMKWNTHILLAISLFICLLSSCQNEEVKHPKWNGVNLVSDRFSMDSTHVSSIVDLQANSAAVIPFAFIPKVNSPNLTFDSNFQWFGETTKGVKQYIGELKRAGLQVMIKPQIWIGGGVFTGFIQMDNEQDWITFEENYSRYILTFAKIAEEEKVELLCIGTEMSRCLKYRPEFWSSLIREVRKVFSGHLTYAENWDCFDAVPFLSEIDFIGVDAYFPLDSSQTPSTENLIQAWQPYLDKLRALSDSIGKKIVFTEYGYRSADYTAHKPWDFGDKQLKVNEEAQLAAYQAVYNLVWKENWFAGGFLWKWHLDHQHAGGKKNNRFTPQNKKAEALIREVYATWK